MLLGSAFLDRFKLGSCFVILLLLVIASGCVPQTPPPALTEEPPRTPTVAPSEDVMTVTTRVDCTCDGKNIVPVLYIQPHNGTPPYLLPDYNFVTYQLIPANLDDILHITLWSSDTAPLKWTGDILMSCAVIPACGTASNSSSPSSSSSGSSASSSSSNSSSSSSKSKLSGSSSGSSQSSSSSSSSNSSSSSSNTSSSSSSGSSSSDSSGSQGSSSSSSSSSSNSSDFPNCPPKPQGGTEPPGICKKKD